MREEEEVTEASSRCCDSRNMHTIGGVTYVQCTMQLTRPSLVAISLSSSPRTKSKMSKCLWCVI